MKQLKNQYDFLSSEYFVSDTEGILEKLVIQRTTCTTQLCTSADILYSKSING